MTVGDVCHTVLAVLVVTFECQVIKIWKAPDGFTVSTPGKHDRLSFTLGWVENTVFYRIGSNPAPKTEYGATCTKCNSIYEHAERVSGFVCWGCRNGY